MKIFYKKIKEILTHKINKKIKRPNLERKFLFELKLQNKFFYLFLLYYIIFYNMLNLVKNKYLKYKFSQIEFNKI